MVNDALTRRFAPFVSMMLDDVTTDCEGRKEDRASMTAHVADRAACTSLVSPERVKKDLFVIIRTVTTLLSSRLRLGRGLHDQPVRASAFLSTIRATSFQSPGFHAFWVDFSPGSVGALSWVST